MYARLFVLHIENKGNDNGDIKMVPLTVFTPAYNRADLLPRCYESMKRQTNKEFIWMIIDDGSTDGSLKILREYEKNDPRVTVIDQENKGVSVARNVGIELALQSKCEFITFMDSDDYLTDDSLETVVKWEATIAGKPGYCGVAGNRGSSPTETPNTSLMSMYGSNYIDEYAFVRYPEYTDKVVDGERAGVWYTEIHRKYKYPEFEGENFLTPCIVWNRMARDGYKIRIFEDIIWVCKYLQDGLTMQGNMRFIKNPAGHGLSIREKAEFLHDPLIKKMKMWYTFYCDHTFCEEQYRLTMKQCAEYIGAPLVMIWCAAAARKLLHFVKGKK